MLFGVAAIDLASRHLAGMALVPVRCTARVGARGRRPQPDSGLRKEAVVPQSTGIPLAPEGGWASAPCGIPSVLHRRHEKLSPACNPWPLPPRWPCDHAHQRADSGK